MNDRIYNKGIDKLRDHDRIQRLEVDKVINICCKDKSFKSLLDIGTGSGVFAEAFSKAGLVVSGIDIKQEMIDAAKINLPDSDFKIAGAENIPYQDNAFDAAFFGLVFHEVSDYRKALSEAYRVSRYLTFILEWKFETEDYGPPIEHRLKSEFIKNRSEEAGYKTFTEVPMTNLVLYYFGKD